MTQALDPDGREFRAATSVAMITLPARLRRPILGAARRLFDPVTLRRRYAPRGADIVAAAQADIEPWRPLASGAAAAMAPRCGCNNMAAPGRGACECMVRDVGRTFRRRQPAGSVAVDLQACACITPARQPTDQDGP